MVVAITVIINNNDILKIKEVKSGNRNKET
jgi:hypothetical protein